MNYIAILKYQIQNDMRRYFGRIKYNGKNGAIIAFFVFLFIYSLLSMIMSIGITLDKVIYAYSCLTMFYISSEGLSIEIVLYFKERKYFGRMLLYPMNIKSICLLHLVKYIALKLLLILFMFFIILLSGITTSQSLYSVLVGGLSFGLSFVLSILIYTIITSFRVLKSNKIARDSYYKYIPILLFNTILGIVIPLNLYRFSNIRIHAISGGKYFLKLIASLLPPSLLYYEGKIFFSFILSYVGIVFILTLVINIIVNIIVKNYIINEGKNKVGTIEKKIIISEKFSILLKKDLYKILRRGNVFKEYCCENILMAFFINTFFISYFIFVGPPDNEKLICLCTLVLAYILFIINHLTTYPFTVLEGDGKFIVHYIQSDYKMGEIIRSKCKMEILLNGAAIIITLIFEIIIYAGSIGKIMLLLLSIIAFVISLAVTHVYGASCFPRYNWSSEDEIQNNLLSTVTTGIFNTIPFLTLEILFVLNLFWHKVGLDFLSKYEFYIFCGVILTGSILNIFLSKIIFKWIGRPYGEYQI
jgi:hypothetical protein